MGLFDRFKGKGDKNGKPNPADKWAQAAGEYSA